MLLQSVRSLVATTLADAEGVVAPHATVQHVCVSVCVCMCAVMHFVTRVRLGTRPKTTEIKISIENTYGQRTSRTMGLQVWDILIHFYYSVVKFTVTKHRLESSLVRFVDSPCSIKSSGKQPVAVTAAQTITNAGANAIRWSKWPFDLHSNHEKQSSLPEHRAE